MEFVIFGKDRIRALAASQMGFYDSKPDFGYRQQNKFGTQCE